MKIFNRYSYQKLDKNLKVIGANNEVMFYKLASILLSLLLIVNLMNVAETKVILKHVKELQTDTLERVVLVRSSNLTKIEFPRSQNLPTALNNPGCIRPGNSDVDKYAIGIVDTKNGPFLAFMNPEQGFKALDILLDSYKNYTVKNMISRYAPSFENDTDLYIQNVCKKLNCKPSTLVKKVNKDLLIEVIAEIEGYKR